MQAFKRRRLVSGFVVGLCVALPIQLRGSTYYWDANGSSLGAGEISSGTWGSSNFWNSNFTGAGATFTTTSGSADSLYFVAGSGTASGNCPYTVVVAGNQNVNGLTFASSGAATLSGTGTINVWSGGLTVSQYAYGLASQGAVTILPQVVLQAPQAWTNNSINPLTIGGSVLAGGNSLTIAGAGNTTIAGNTSGSGTLVKIGAGTLTLNGSNACGGGLSVGSGGVLLAGSGGLTTGNSGNVLVGTSGPAALTIQDSGSLSVGGELDVNYGYTSGNASTLALRSGSLVVNGPTYVGRAAMRNPGSTSAAVYQSGGTAALTGLVTVGFAGTATSLYDIDGGILTATGGLLVGGGAAKSGGNGAVNIHGSGVVNVCGSGLVIGQDSYLSASGNVTLSAGSLNVGTSSKPANITLGNGGLASFTHSGGTMNVTGSLLAGGIGTLVLDAAGGNAAASFGGSLARIMAGTPMLGLLDVVPNSGHLATTEGVSFGTAPPTTNGIIGPWAVSQASGVNSAGDFLTTSAHNLTTATSAGAYTDTNFASPAVSGTSVECVSGSAVAAGINVYALKVDGTAMIAGGQTLTVNSGGLIVNGGTVSGGTLVFGSEPLIFAGSSNTGTIRSAIQTSSSSGLVKWGPGRLVLAGNNSGLQGGIVVGTGTLNIQDGNALGLGGTASSTTVAAGAALEIQQGITVKNVSVTINGTGPNNGGALCNVQDDNTLTSPVSLGSDTQINTAAGSLTLAGPVQSTNYALTKTGTGKLVLTADNSTTLSGPVTVASGILVLRNSVALGHASSTGTATVQSGAALLLDGGISVPGIPLCLSGAGPAGGDTGGDTGSGALQSQGNNSYAGPITLAADSQVHVNSGSLSLPGAISGGFAWTKAGSGTLVLSGSNSFTETMSVLEGTLSVALLNSSTTAGPLGQSTAPIVLGSSAKTGVFEYTATSSTASDRGFTLAASGTGRFQVDQAAANLTLSGPLGGNGSLQMSGGGRLVLSGTSGYTGTTTVSGGTRAIDPAGSIGQSSGILIGRGALLQVTAGTTGGNQLPDTGNLTLSGGTLAYAANGSYGSGETVGALVLNPGQSQVVLSNTGTGAPCLGFTGGTSRSTGATVGFSTSGAQIEFLASPPALVNGILPYAFVVSPSSTSVDFATWPTSGSVSVVSALAYSASTTGDIGPMLPATYGLLNVTATGGQSTLTVAHGFNSLKLVGPTSIAMTGTGSITLNSGGLICTGAPSVISSGGYGIGTGNGELIVNTAADLMISCTISASAALTKTGTATLTLTSMHPLDGNTFLNQGTLAYCPAGNLNYVHSISGPGNLLMCGDGAMLTLAGTNTYTGSTTVTGGTLCVNGSLAGGSGVSLQNGATLSGSGSIAGDVTAEGGRIAHGASIKISGSVSVSSGVLTIGPVGAGCVTVGGGVSLSGSATLAASSTAAAISGNLNYTSNSSSTYSGLLQGSGKTVTFQPQGGNAMLVLSGSNTYSGGTIIQGGTLQTASAGALGTGGVWLNGGTLDLDGTDMTIASLSSSGGRIITSAGTSKLTVSLVGGVATSYSGGLANGGAGSMLSLTKSGPGTLVLSGTDTYTGGTTVADGTLYVTKASALPNGAALVLGADGTFVFDPMRGVGVPPAPSSVFVSPASVTPVPEPGTIALLLAALWSAAIYRRFQFRFGRRRGRRRCGTWSRPHLACRGGESDWQLLPTSREEPPVSPAPVAGGGRCGGNGRRLLAADGSSCQSDSPSRQAGWGIS